MTVAYAPSQAGYEDIVAGTWTDGVPAVQTATYNAGFQFSVPAPSEVLFRSLVLTLDCTNAVSVSGTLTVGMVDELNGAVFSNGNLPSAQTLIPVYSATETIVLGNSITVTFSLDAPSPATGGFVGNSLDTAARLLGHSDFQGKVALVLSFTGGLGTFTGNESLVVDTVPFLTGLLSTKTMQSRADFCPRCGSPMFRERLVKDGYTKSMVCPSCWDPPEVKRRPWRPPKEISR